MSAAMLLTGGVLLAVVVVLARELYAPAPTMLAGLVVLAITDVLPAAEAFRGFSSPATLTIAGLFVVARALQVHGGIAPALARLLGTAGSDRAITARLTLPIMALSSLVANTPLVAAIAPLVRSWADRHGRAASKFLIPVSFAALLGGVVTTIGTSTTLVVSGLVADSSGDGFTIFEVLPLGLPVALVGGVLLVALGPRFLPDRRSPYQLVATHERDYTFRLQVAGDGPLDGRTVDEAALRHLADVFLASVARGAREITPVTPDTVLRGGDVLTFVGRVDQVVDLSNREGLAHADETQISLLGDDRKMIEVVIGAGSPLVNRTPKQVSFRGLYGAAIVAIHRQGRRVDAKLGEVALEPGDALLLRTDADFEDRYRRSSDFAAVVTMHDVAPPVRTWRRPFVLATALGMVVAAGLGVELLVAVLAACLLLVASRTLTFWEARGSLDLDILVIVASAIGLGAAMEASGLAGEVADLVAGVAGGGSDRLGLLAVLLGTLVLTELITNVAAAALMVPVALDVAVAVGADPRGYAVAVAVMASSSFLTPIGYQTNTIVYGLGGYRFGDYWRLGLPLTVTVLVVAILVVPVVWG